MPKMPDADLLLKRALSALETAHFRGSAEIEAAGDRAMAPFFERVEELGKRYDRLADDAAALRELIKDLDKENQRLKAILAAHGIDS